MIDTEYKHQSLLSSFLIRENLPLISIAVLVIFYLIGIVGILIPIHEDFIFLTPLNLLVSAFIVLGNHSAKDLRFFIFGFICFIVGFGVEMAGVNYGFLFGNYQYGPVLGWKLFETPLIIGLNWLLLVYGSGMTVRYLFPKLVGIVRAFIAAAIMVGLDVLIEPVAIAYDFWSWDHETIPLSNYLGWFGVAFLLLLLFEVLTNRRSNKVAVALLTCQFMFFGILNWNL